jgi:hypothetical protein
MGQPAELLDTLPLDFDDTLAEAMAEPISARRAFALWVVALIGYAAF